MKASDEQRKYPVRLDLLLCPTRVERSQRLADLQSRRSIACPVPRPPLRCHSYPLAARDQSTNPGEEERLQGALNRSRKGMQVESEDRRQKLGLVTYSSTCPQTFPSFVLALAFLTLLGRQFLRDLAELRE